MTSLREDWRRYRALAPARRALLREALAALFAARAALACLPFRRIAAWLGTLGAESGTELTAEHEAAVEDVAWSVQAMAHRVPWDSRCLAQALAAYRLLKRRGIAATVYFGVKRDPAVPFSAHAWVRCGGRIVTGAAGVEAYTVLMQFARERP
jgi:hypothetical protein